MNTESVVPKFYCPFCWQHVLPTPTGYLCQACGSLTILQVISERVAEIRRKNRDERNQSLP